MKQLSDLVFVKPGEHGDGLREIFGPNWRQTLDDLLAQGAREAEIDAEYLRQARVAFDRMVSEGGRPN